MTPLPFIRFGFFAASLVLSHIPALAQDVSPWSETRGGAIRLLPGDASAAQGGFIGLEIRLDRDWKTYWRTPGEAGIPPSFDWSASQNLASAEVLWPAPIRLDDRGGSSIVYVDDTILPLRVKAKDPTQPVELHLSLDYALCNDVCVPARGEARITLPTQAQAPDSDGHQQRGTTGIQAAMSRIPASIEIGELRPLTIRSVKLDTSRDPALLTVETASPVPASLFIEGPETWYLPMPSPASSSSASGANTTSSARFVLPLEGIPKGEKISGKLLKLTLSTGREGVEATYRLP